MTVTTQQSGLTKTRRWFQNSIPAVLVLMTAFGCELAVEIDVPFDKNDWTLNTIFNPDSTWQTQIAFNRFVLTDSSFKPVENATVVIYENELPLDTLTPIGGGHYRSRSKPDPGKIYRIKASGSGHETLSAESFAPPVTNIESTTLTLSARQVDGRPNALIQLTFTDSPQENFYQIRFLAEVDAYNFNSRNIFTRTVRIFANVEDPAYQNDNNEGDDGLLLSDALFNGKKVEFNFNTDDLSIKNAGAVWIQLNSLSDDLYKYKTTLALQGLTSGNPFAQPVNVYNNIEHGFGIFGGYSSSKVLLHTNPKPKIFSVSRTSGNPGDHVVITGENFATNSRPNFSNVFFHASDHMIAAQSVEVSETRVEVVIPNGAVTGKILIVGNGKLVLSESDLRIDN